MAFDEREPRFVPVSSVLNQSFKYAPLPPPLRSPTSFENVLQPEGTARLKEVSYVPLKDAASRNVVRDLDAFEGGSNFGTTMTNLIRGLAYGESDYIDAAAARGEDVILNMIIDPEDMLLAQPYLDQDQTIHATRARRSKLHTIIQATRNPNFNGGEHYDVMREQNPRAFQMLENLGYTKDTFENAISATDFNFRMQYPLMRQSVERIRALDPQMQGAGEFFREMGMRHFIEDPLNLALMITPLAAPKLFQGLGNLGIKSIQQGAKVGPMWARAPLTATGHSLLGGARGAHALHHGAASKLGYAATWALEFGFAGASIDVLEQLQTNSRMNQVLANIPEPEREMDYGRTLAAFGMTGALGGFVGGLGYGILPRNATVEARHAFAEFMTGGQMSVRRSYSVPSVSKAILTVGDDNVTRRIYDRARVLLGDDVSDTDLGFLVDERTLASVGSDRGIAMVFLDMVEEAMPEGQTGHITRDALREGWADWSSQYRQIYQAAPDRYSMTGVRYDAIRKTLEDRTVRLQQGETGTPVQAAMTKFLRANKEIADVIEQRNIPGTREWNNRLHHKTMSLLGNRELRRASRAVEDALNPRADRATTAANGKVDEVLMDVGFDPWAIPTRGVTRVPIDELQPLPGLEVNPSRVDFYRDRVDMIDRTPIEVERMADGALRVTDGNHRLAAALAEGVEEIPIRIRKSAPEPEVTRLYDEVARTDAGSEANPTNRSLRQKLGAARKKPLTREQQLSLGRVESPRDLAVSIQRSFNLSDGETALIEEVIDRAARAWAKSWNSTPREYLTRFWAPSVRANMDEFTLATAGLMDNNRIIIRANASKENPSALRTALHELFHGFSQTMPQEQRLLLNRWSQRQARRILDKNKDPKARARLERQTGWVMDENGKARKTNMVEALEQLANMTDDELVRFSRRGALGPGSQNVRMAEEMGADGSTLWLSGGKSSSQEMESLFQRFRYWLSSMFNFTFRKIESRYDLHIENDVDRLFASLLNAGDAPHTPAGRIFRRQGVDEGIALTPDAQALLERAANKRLTTPAQRLADRVDGPDAPPHLKARVKQFKEELGEIRERVERGIANIDDEQRGLAIVLALEEAGIAAEIPQPTVRLRPDGTKSNNVTRFTSKEWNPTTEAGRELKRMINSLQSEEALDPKVVDPTDTPSKIFIDQRTQLLNAQRAREESFQRLTELKSKENTLKSMIEGNIPGEEVLPEVARGMRVEHMAEALETLPEDQGEVITEMTKRGSTLQNLKLSNLLARITTARTGAWRALQSTSKSIRYAADMLDTNLFKTERLTALGEEVIDSTFMDGQNQAITQVFEGPANYLQGMIDRGVFRNTKDIRKFVRSVYEHHYGVKTSDNPDVAKFLEITKKGLKELGEEGLENGRLETLLDNFLPQRWNPQKVSRNREVFTNKLTENFVRKWRERDAVYNDALVDMGWARRVEDIRSNTVRWEPTDRLPEEFGGVLPTTRQQLSNFADQYDASVNTSARASANRATQRILSQDNYRVDSRGHAVRQTGHGVLSDAERRLGLEAEDLKDGVLLDFMDMDIMHQLESYASTTGTEIKARSIVQRSVPGAIKGQTTPEEFLEAVRMQGERFYQSQNMDTNELTAAFRALESKYQHMIGRAPNIMSETDSISEWAALMGREMAGVLWNSGVTFLSAATELPRGIFGRAYSAADIIDNIREFVGGGLISGVGSKSRHRERLLSFGTASQLWRSGGYARFMGETHVSPMAMFTRDRLIQPWQEVGETATNPTLSLPSKIGRSMVMGLRAVNQNLSGVSGLNALTNRLKSLQIYEAQRELATFLPAAQRLSELLPQNKAAMDEAATAAYNAAIAKGQKAPKARRASQEAKVKMFKGLAREAGFGSEWHIALRMQEHRLLDPDVIPMISRLATDTGARIGKNAGSMTKRPFMDVVGMRQASLGVADTEAAVAEKAVRRLNDYVERGIRRYLNEPSPWTSATDVASRTHWGRLANTFLSFAMGAVVNVGMASNQMPLHRGMGMILTYTLFDYAGQMARRVARGESMDSIMEDWESDPEKQFSRIVARWPGWGLYSMTGESIINSFLGSSRSQKGGSAGATAQSQFMETLLSALAVPGAIARGDDPEFFDNVKQMSRTVLPGVGLMERAISGEWPRGGRRGGSGASSHDSEHDAKGVMERIRRGFEQDDREWPNGFGEQEGPPVDIEPWESFWQSVLDI